MKKINHSKGNEMKPKHTPGPWFSENGAIFTLQGARHVADMANRTAFSIEGEQGQANARLIAAAPELLTWVEELLKQVKQDNPNKMAGVIEHVETLLQRVRGES